MLDVRSDASLDERSAGDKFVELVDVQHSFDGRHLLFEGISQVLLPSRSYALIGPSGSGKSTLLGIISGSVTPTFGSVRKNCISSTGWVFQNPHGSARRSAIDHVVLPFLAKGESRALAEERATDLLETFGLQEKGYASFAQLSGGEAQRLMLARAVAFSPDLLLVDEPTAQLDTATAEVVIQALAKVSSGGSIVVVATHDSRAADACHTIIELVT
ncbi:ABC transporter ATP-binding protein [Rathayibacter iranicus]|uniref:ABC transporter n=2 Tax=Rathayibacter iranicus TaxID=59737 RepID=A0AAD1ACV7_9MICO|nr:ATP-binding cassette domain-containing protein [Rathayibacter iranicus]AZZ55892.1 ABC transporter [Rathayibacter iranicus]MWV30667.1 ATP-binding cassette domain-containing protein [Rathayibacter iranicus NCPPB 2253 = VKM Ac-1602]PPI47216.1 ABC transporter [Rathayibacter iranicus]PPI60259.1 ABC transporter [Rathayibacter iranicus]PPI71723.1 ABC transporter [Rathayibacter iranicus]